MAGKEGIIKYDLDHTFSDALPADAIAEVNRYRKIMHELDLIGQDPARYGGYGFGNISVRIEPFPADMHHRCFTVTGTQTGGLDELGIEHYAIVDYCVPTKNILTSSGPIKPSSEAITHGAVYDCDEAIHCVIHVHSPEIWHAAARLGLPITDPEVPYGSPELASEVARIFAETDLPERRVFTMGGHEDGVIAFGPTAESAASVLLAVLEQAKN